MELEKRQRARKKRAPAPRAGKVPGERMFSPKLSILVERKKIKTERNRNKILSILSLLPLHKNLDNALILSDKFTKKQKTEEKRNTFLLCL
jgi:hypothetical protein